MSSTRPPTEFSRYLIAQTTVNASFGIIIGVGMWLIGVPNPALWGIVGMLLRFLPYVGVPLAALFPAALSIAVDPGWSMLFWTLGVFFVTEPIMGQVIEPLIYGQSTGLSPVAVIVSAMIWTWLWGPIGLILSTPLTVCLVVLGRHVDSLHFLYILMGDKPALTPEESFYQRVLAGDPDEVPQPPVGLAADDRMHHGTVSRPGRSGSHRRAFARPSSGGCPRSCVGQPGGWR